VQCWKTSCCGPDTPRLRAGAEPVARRSGPVIDAAVGLATGSRARLALRGVSRDAPRTPTTFAAFCSTAPRTYRSRIAKGVVGKNRVTRRKRGVARARVPGIWMLICRCSSSGSTPGGGTSGLLTSREGRCGAQPADLFRLRAFSQLFGPLWFAAGDTVLTTTPTDAGRSKPRPTCSTT
jgi:hypothetical protein